SLLLFALLLQLLVTGTRPARRIVPVMMVFILWVNLHGGWIVGGGALAGWACCAVAGRGDARQRLEWIGVGVAALVATLVNPYGWRLWTFLWSTVGLGRADI